MATYLRPTSPDIFNPVLFNAPVDRLAGIARTRQIIYDGQVNAIASQTNDYLGLEQNAFYEFNKPRIAEFNKKATEQMNKIATADFSLRENQVAADNIWKPLQNDPYIIKDQDMANQERQGVQTFREYQAIDNKSRKEGKASNLYSDGNFQHWMRSVNKAKKAAPDEIDLYNIDTPTSFIDVTGKLLKLAKDMDVKVVSSGPTADGKYIQTVTNGKEAITPIRQFFSSALNAEDFKQLNIDSDNQKYSAINAHIMEQRAIGRSIDEDVAERELGLQVYEKALPYFTQQRQLHDKQYNSLKAEVDKYDLNAPHTDLEAQTYQTKQELMNYHKQQADGYNEYINDTPDKSLAGWQYFKEKYKNKTIDDLASSYAGATVQVKKDVDDFALAKYKAQLEEIGKQEQFKRDLTLAQIKKTQADADKAGKKAPAPKYSPVGVETVINPEEIGNTYDLHVDQKKVLLDQIVKDTNKFFDVQHNSRVFEKLDQVAEVDGKGNVIKIGQTGLTASEIRTINEVLQKQGFQNIANTSNNSVSFIKKQMDQYKSEEMDRLLKDPGAEVGTNVELQTYLGRITEYRSKVNEMNAAERTAWDEALVNRVQFGADFTRPISGRTGTASFEVTDLFDQDGKIISKSEFITKAVNAEEAAILQRHNESMRNLEVQRQAALRSGNTTLANELLSTQAVSNLQLADFQETIQNKWGEVYDKNIKKARTALDNYTTSHFENNGWKPQAFTIDNEAEQKLVATRALTALEGNTEEFWRGDYSNDQKIRESIGVLNNILAGEEKGVAVVTTAELGGSRNYVTIRFEQAALNKIKEAKILPESLYEEIATRGLRVKNIETPLSEGGKGRTIYDLQIQAGTPVDFDLSYSPDNPMKANITYKRNLNGPGGKYDLQVQTLVPDVDPNSGELRFNEKGGVKFKYPTSNDVIKQDFPIDTGAPNDIGSVEYILPAMRDIVTARRVFYAWANSGKWRKSNPNIKTVGDLYNLFKQEYQGIDPLFFNESTVQPQGNPFDQIR